MNEVMYQPAPGKADAEPSIQMHGTNLKVVEEFHPLKGCTIDDEVNCRIAKASAAFGQLRSKVWERRVIRLSSKLQLHKAVVHHNLVVCLWTLSYLCQMWQKIESVSLDLPLQAAEHLVARQNLRHWSRHMLILHKFTPSCNVLKFAVRAMSVACRIHNTLNSYFMVSCLLVKDPLEVSGKDWKTVTRCLWKNVEFAPIHGKALRRTVLPGALPEIKASVDSESSRLAECRRKCEVCKMRAASTSLAVTQHFCPTRGWYVHARIGLISHLRTYRAEFYYADVMVIFTMAIRCQNCCCC